jgi:hypothetical protein
MKRHVIIAALVAVSASATADAKEGFGMGLTKQTAALVRTSPPAVFLMGTKLRVDAANAGGHQALAERLKSQLESELLSRDDRLTLDPAFAETLVEVTVLHNEASERWESRKEQRSRKVGEDSKGKAIYKTEEVTVKYRIVTHSFGASFRVTDLTRNASLDADTIEIPFEGSFREGADAPEVFTLENQAIAQAVDAVARRITPTREQISVLLPKGSFKDLIRLAQAAEWNRYLEAVERTAESSKPRDEAFRQYALGTAYEALGYATDEPEVTLRYLEKADLHYDKAIELHPAEKFFSKSYDNRWTSKSAMAPLERVRSSLVNYRRLKDFQDNYETMVAASDPSAAGGKSLAGNGGGDRVAGERMAGERMDNAAVIRMVRAGLGHDIILTAIDNAESPAFDVSPNGLIELSAAEVDEKVIRRIQELAARPKAGDN